MVDDGSVFRLFLIKRENGGALADVLIKGGFELESVNKGAANYRI